MPSPHADEVLASELDGLAIHQLKFDWSGLLRAAARNTNRLAFEVYGHS
jgi:hypothetical protein